MPTELSTSTLEQFGTFGDLLRFLRRRAGITQMELALAVGYSDAQISRLEQNLRLPDIPTVNARFTPALGLENEPRAIARLLDLAANVRREHAPGVGLCPYKGLSFFDEADSDLFVGREALTSRLLERALAIASGAGEAGPRFLGIVGASGSGKSSLLRAGFVPALRWSKESADWPIHVFTPGAHPLESLAVSLTQDRESVADAAVLIDDLARDPRSLQLFAKRRLVGEPRGRLLIVVDQFEELFSLCRSPQQQAAFLECLLAAASESNGPVMVVVALRADFYAHCASHAPLREALARNQEFIGAMTDDELRRAIEEPAKRSRWELEAGLADLMLHDVGREPGALPLLSHALLETWQRRRGRMLTFGGYASSGGVRGAIAETAESVYVDQLTHEQQDLARRLFMRLTQFGEDTAGEDSRRRVGFDELTGDAESSGSMRSLIQRLADARLISTSEQAVEVAHEALIREWPRLRSWLDENRQGLRIHRRITEAAAEWSAGGGDPEMLWRGARLTEAEDWNKINDTELNSLEREFLAESAAARRREVAEKEAVRQRELESAQRLAASEQQHAAQMSRRAMYLGAAVVVALGMALAALFLGAQSREIARTAQTERRIATARELSAAALNNLTVDPERSILLALQALSTTRAVDGTVLPEALGALHRSLVGSPARLTLSGHDAGVMSAAFSPDGSRVATIGVEGTIIVWDASTGERLLRVPGTFTPGDQITPERITYSPDGKRLLACEGDQIVLLDSASGEILRSWTGHQAEVIAVSFSPDATLIASGDAAGAVMVWQAQVDEPLFTLVGHTDGIESVTFSPDARMLVSAGDDAAMRIWDLKTGALLNTFADFTGVVGPAAFSPDGSSLAFTTVDGLHMWSLEPATPDGTPMFEAPEQPVIPATGALAFSPDGETIATGAPLALWDAHSGSKLLDLVGHTDWVMGLAFSPDGTRLASTSTDETVRIWETGLGGEAAISTTVPAGFGTRLAYDPAAQEYAVNGGDGSATLSNGLTGATRLEVRGHKQEVMSVAYSSDGLRFATGSMDGSAIVWDTASGARLLALGGHEYGVRDLAFSPDGKLIATGGFDGTARVWSSATGELMHEIIAHEGLIVGVAFPPDGTRLATSGTDGVIMLWDVKSFELLFTLTGHTGAAADIAFSPDGSRLLSGSRDGTAIIWDSSTGTPLRTLEGHRGEIQSVAWSPDGTLVATGSGDNTARVWDADTGVELLSLPGSQGGINGVAFSTQDDGAQLVVASNDGRVRAFLLRLEPLLNLARSRLTRQLTNPECTEFLHVDACPAVAGTSP